MKQVYATTNETKNGVEVTLHEASIFPRTPVNGKEIEAYIARGRELEPNKKLIAIDVTIEGEEAEIRYEYEPVKFERIRRITGYLVGTLDRFNDAKRAEELEREKHGVEPARQVGKEYSIDLTALLIERVGSRKTLAALEDGAEVEIEFDQKLVIERNPRNDTAPYIDLYTNGTIAVCDGETVAVEWCDSKQLILRSTDDTFNASTFALTPYQAMVCLNGFRYTDSQLEDFWGQLGDIPIDEDENIEEDFLRFEAGTNRYEIWKWFDRFHSKGVAYLMAERK